MYATFLIVGATCYLKDMQSDNKPNLIVDLSFEFALAIIKYAESLDTNRKYIISKQLLRSGTSIGANVRESQNSESRNDFIHKMKIAAKEAGETEYWLLLCQSSDEYPNCEALLSKCTSIMKVLSKIIASAKSSH